MGQEPFEHQIQSAFFDLIRVYANKDDRFQDIFAIPNQRGNDFYWLKMKKEEGLKKGVLDVFVSVPSGPYHGLYIEFKAGKNKLSEAQAKFADRMTKRGFLVVVAREAISAFNTVKKYFFEPERFLDVETKKGLKTH